MEAFASGNVPIFCSHMSPVFRSVMVPFPLFWYLSAPPARTTPSSRTGASVIFRVGGNEVVCLSRGTCWPQGRRSAPSLHSARR